MSANTRYAALNDGGLRRPRRGHATSTSRGRRASGSATYADTHRPRVRLHQRAAAPAGRARRTSPRTGTPRRCSPGRSSRSAPTRRSSSASGCGPRPGSSCSAGHRHPVGRAEEPGRAAAGVLRRAVDHLDLRPVRGERPLLPGAAAGGHRRGPGGGARGGRGPAAAGAAAAQRHRLPLEPADLRHRRRHAAPAGREPRAAGRPDHRRRAGQRGLLLRRRCACWPTRTGRSGPR